MLYCNNALPSSVNAHRRSGVISAEECGFGITRKPNTSIAGKLLATRDDSVRAAFPPPNHDHRRCVDDVVERARRAFEENGLKFTHLREKLLREIATSHQAIGLYELIERLRNEGGALPQTQSIQQSLHFWTPAWFVASGPETRTMSIAAEVPARPAHCLGVPSNSPTKGAVAPMVASSPVPLFISRAAATSARASRVATRSLMASLSEMPDDIRNSVAAAETKTCIIPRPLPTRAIASASDRWAAKTPSARRK
jgi:hypothetical protein